MMFYVFMSFAVFMLVLGIVVTVSKAKDKQKMDNLLNGRSVITTAPAVKHDMPVEEWKDLVGLRRYEYFVEKCTNGNRPIYVSMLEKYREYEQVSVKQRKLSEDWTATVGEIDIATTDAQRDALSKKLTVISEERLSLINEGPQLLREVHALENTIDYSLGMSIVYTPVPSVASGIDASFEVSEKIFGSDSFRGLAIDNKNRQIALLTPYSKEVVSFEQIVSSEVCIDSRTVVKSDLGNLVFRAAVGGILTGGVGAIVGGVTGSKQSIENVRKVDLKVLVKGASNPIYNIAFYQHGDLADAKTAIAHAGHWHDLLTVAMKVAEGDGKIERSTSFSDAHKPTLSTELESLARLKQSGVLSEIEFSVAKAKLLA